MTPAATSISASARQSFQAAMRGLIDYAGMYPPAGLPLAAAWENYLAYRRSADAWMLGHFVLPAGEVESLAKLANADGLAHDRTAAAPMTLAIVCRPAPSQDGWLRMLADDLGCATRGVAASAGRVAIAAIEAKLPEDVIQRADASATVEFAAAIAVSREAFPDAALFLESPLVGSAGPASVEPHIAGLAAAAAKTSSALGFKLRAGGLETAAFPSAGQVALVIDACRRHRLIWKATAGLHHPIRHYRDEVKTKMHGFVNLLAAAALAEACEAPVDQLAAILADESPEHFRFDAAGLTWKGRTATPSQIELVRRERFVSFGSCSFDEPRDDLRSLGWLEQ